MSVILRMQQIHSFLTTATRLPRTERDTRRETYGEREGESETKGAPEKVGQMAYATTHWWFVVGGWDQPFVS